MIVLRIVKKLEKILFSRNLRKIIKKIETMIF